MCDQVVEYDRVVINDDRVKIRVVASMEPHPMSPSGDEDFGYQTVKNSIRQIWNNTYVAPGNAHIENAGIPVGKGHQLFPLSVLVVLASVCLFSSPEHEVLK